MTEKISIAVPDKLADAINCVHEEKVNRRIESMGVESTESVEGMLRNCVRNSTRTQPASA